MKDIKANNKNVDSCEDRSKDEKQRKEMLLYSQTRIPEVSSMSHEEVIHRMRKALHELDVIFGFFADIEKNTPEIKELENSLKYEIMHIFDE